MPELSVLYDLIAKLLPLESMQMRFMQQALVGLVLLAPMVALMGVQVVNFRMAFFADAISHSAFTGVALGLILAVSPHWTMPIFGLLVGLAIMASQRRSALSTDTVIGVFFSGVVAFGLAVVSRDKNVARDIQRFLYGDILTIGNNDIWAMIVLLAVLIFFQIYGYNRMLYIGLNTVVAKVHGVRVAAYQYVYAGLLSFVVIFSVWAVGVLLVTAMLIVPAAAARNLARTAGGMVWWALLVSTTSAVIGLLISAQEWARTATGATVILVAFVWFLVSSGVDLIRGEGSVR
ncbi:metal ABC transporter permease [Desulfatitalea tepidiphila]|uniref:metal ABC transporter permease n=1 Tax=Desulfatitalea tepidiphila TaxID=1185843 RepID=UPI0006B5AE71|nr:metal ABC transporter permease [Desulfatitalea tepidiphila]